MAKQDDETTTNRAQLRLFDDGTIRTASGFTWHNDDAVTLSYGQTLKLVCSDITDEQVDVIVNAANPSLLGGGGVDGAIHAKGGLAIRNECQALHRALGGCKTGDAVMTTAGDLRARFVVHAVGPRYRGGNHGEAQLLTSAYQKSLALCANVQATSVAFPALSTGMYGYPLAPAAHIALSTVIAALCAKHASPTTLREVRFVLFANADLLVYRTTLRALIPRTGGFA
jgi:O-acetyl-ADP-ribose deacetylase